MITRGRGGRGVRLVCGDYLEGNAVEATGVELLGI